MEYKIDDNWTSTVYVSKKGYTSKPTDPQCRMMKFDERNISLAVLSELISEGHTFCTTSRRLEDVGETHIVAIDIDGADKKMEDFVENLKVKPTLYYTTFSNGPEDNRFRLIYAVGTTISGDVGYNKAYEYIASSTGIFESAGDSVDVRAANQMYHGCYGCEVHNTGRIYSIPGVFTGNSEIKRKYKPDDILSPDVIQVFRSTRRIGVFINKYISVYGCPGVQTETPYVPSDIDGMLIPAGDYMCVPKRYWFFDQTRKERVYRKWVDGQNRHGKLWLAGLIIRVLNPSLSPDEMFFGYLDYIYRNIDLFNKDKSVKYTHERILDEFCSVMSEDLSSFKIDKEPKHCSYHVDPMYCLKKGITKTEAVRKFNSIIRTEKKEILYNAIDSIYDSKMKHTRKEWLRILSDNGIVISLRTLDNFLYEYGYSKNKRNDK